MAITTGSRLGPYEIVALIGAGGMGEVYKARDTRLDRSVAIKVLPREFADNAQLKLRFEREAKTISQLTHAHICTLYDVGNDQGVEYLVMELLDGETLADRIERGPLPMRDVLRYGGEIASALDRAHRGGVVHRDLKPGNVMITKSGAKLLDFGLAKGGAISHVTMSGPPSGPSRRAVSGKSFLRIATSRSLMLEAARMKNRSWIKRTALPSSASSAFFTSEAMNFGSLHWSQSFSKSANSFLLLFGRSDPSCLPSNEHGFSEE